MRLVVRFGSGSCSGVSFHLGATFDLGGCSCACSGACSGVCSGVEMLSFTGDTLLLKLLKTVSLAPKHNSVLFIKDFFSTDFRSPSEFLNLLANLIYRFSVFSNDKYHSYIFLKEQYVNDNH